MRWRLCRTFFRSEKGKDFFRMAGMALLIFVTLHILVKNIHPNALAGIMRRGDARFFGLGVLFLFAYWVLEAVMLRGLVKRSGAVPGKQLGIRCALIGQFYSYLTPFASGGQPMQVLYMGQRGIPAAQAMAVVVIKFLLFQFTVTVFALASMAVHLPAAAGQSFWTSGLALTTAVVNGVGLCIIALAAYRPGVIEILIRACIRLLAHMRWVRDPNKLAEGLRKQMQAYHEALHEIHGSFVGILGYFLLSLLQIMLYFSIAWCVYRGLGLHGASLLQIMGIQSICYMATAFIPTPGALGASEAVFALLMGTIYTPTYSVVGTLIWRVLTYYFGLAVTGLAVLGIHLSNKKTQRSNF